MIDAADLDFVSGCVGADPAGCDADVDGDGVVDETDVRAVERDFGFTVVTLPLELPLPVVDSGITAVVGEPGAAPVATGASRAGDPITLTVEEEGAGGHRLSASTYSGAAVSPELGELAFSQGDGGGIELSIDSATGELVGGGVSLELAGEDLDDLPTLSLAATGGQLLFARGELRLLVVGASRILPGDFHLFPGLELRLVATGVRR